MRTQFIISESDKEKRGLFYDYITNNYKFKIWFPYTKEKFISSEFPFVVDFEENSFWVCESITCCACAAQAKIIISISQFLENEKDIIKIKKYSKLLKAKH